MFLKHVSAPRSPRLRALICTAGLVASVGCGTEDATAPAPTAAADPLAPSLATSATASGIAFGDFHLPTANWKAPYTGALLALSNGSAVSRLSSAKSAGMRLVISLAGNRRNYANADNTFSMSKWKARINAYRSLPLTSYVASGTVLGHYLADEPTCVQCWGGKRISTSEIEEMARYSKSIWPSMPTTVRAAPTKLEKVRFRNLDFAWAQWEGKYHGTSWKMTPEKWRDTQVNEAKSRGLGLVFGLNYLDGGDGSSRILGTYTNARRVNRWQMSAAEVRKVGTVLAGSSYACALLSWEYNSTFVHRSGMSSALNAVASTARNRSRSPCAK